MSIDSDIMIRYCPYYFHSIQYGFCMAKDSRKVVSKSFRLSWLYLSQCCIKEKKKQKRRWPAKPIWTAMPLIWWLESRKKLVIIQPGPKNRGRPFHIFKGRRCVGPPFMKRSTRKRLPGLSPVNATPSSFAGVALDVKRKLKQNKMSRRTANAGRCFWPLATRACP